MINDKPYIENSGNDKHACVVRMLGFTLTRDDVDGWSDFSWFLHHKLAQREIAAFAWAGLRALNEENATKVLEYVACRAGYPMTPLILEAISDEANWWGENASTPELRAYAVAAYKRLSVRDRRLIVEHFEHASAL